MDFNISRDKLIDGLSNGIDFWIECKEITKIASSKSSKQTQLTEKFEQAHVFLKNKIAMLECTKLDDKFVEELNY